MGGMASAHHAVDGGARLSEHCSCVVSKGGDVDETDALIPLTVPEIRRLLCRLVWNAMPTEDHTLRWSWWRRWKQKCVQISHYKRRGVNLANQPP